MKLTAALALVLLGWTNLRADDPIPIRYQGLNRTRLLELKAILGHPEQPVAFGHIAVFSLDGKLGLFSGGGGADGDGRTDESFLSLWDVPAGRTRSEIRIPGKAITALALSRDGKHALTGHYANDGKKNETFDLVYWSLESGKAIHSFPLKDKEPCVGVAFAPDGKRALAALGAVAVAYLDLEKGKPLIHIAPKNKKGDDHTLALTFVDADRALLARGAEMHLWDLKKNQPIRVFQGHDNRIVHVVPAPDGKHFATSAVDDTVKLWELSNEKELATLKKGPPGVTLISIAFTGVKKQILCVTTVAGTDSDVSLWDPDAGKELWSKKARFEGLVPISVSKGGKEAILGGGAAPFCLWNLDLGVEERVWGGHKAPVLSLATTGSGQLLSGSQEGHLKYWDKSGPLHYFGHTDSIFAMTRGADDLLLTASADKTVKLWNVKTGAILHTFRGHDGNVTGAVFGPGKWIASAGGDRVIRTWDRDTGKPIASITGHSESINGLAISPDGAWLATASDDNSVRLWPVKDGKLLKEPDVVILEGHKRQVMCVTFTADGKYLISGSQDKTLRVWDIAKEKTVRVLEGHQNWVNSVLVWKDKVLSTGDDFRVYVWSLETGKVLDVIDLTPYGDCPRSLAVTGDGNGFYVGTSGWVIMRFDTAKK